MLPSAPGQTPFASAQVDMGTNLAPSAANSNQIVALLASLLFTSGAGAFVALLLCAGFFALKGPGPMQGVLDGTNGKTHIRDTGEVKDPELRKIRQQIRAGNAAAAAKAEAEKDPNDELFGGLGAGPVSITVTGPGREAYHGIEITCGQFRDYRGRAKIVNDKAYVAVVPATKCQMYFQGGVPVRVYVTGGDTRTCSFNPIVCR